MRRVRRDASAFGLSAAVLVLAALITPAAAGQSGPKPGADSVSGEARSSVIDADAVLCLSDHGPGYLRSVHAYDVPDVKLVDSNGNPFALRPALNHGSPLLLNFIFTSCPTICPIMSATFSQAQPELEAEQVPPRMLSISIDPEHDTPTRLKEYAERFDANAGWEFLTGDLETIIAVQKAFGAFQGDKMNHRPLTFLRPSGEDVWVRLEGLTSADDLIREYRKLVSSSHAL